MKKLLSNKIPFGVQDYLYDECYNRKLIADRLLAEFELWGYKQIDTPSIEYYDTFSLSSVELDQRSMFKMTDSDGSLLVLRPDITLPISRIVATKLDSDKTNRLCYVGNIFKNTSTTDVNPLREQMQAGVEYIGEGGNEVDADMISLAITSLKKVGIENCVVELGHINFFKGLMQEYGIEPELAEQIRLLVEKKNMLELEMLLFNNGITKEAQKCLTDITTLFGDISVIGKAKSMCSNQTSLQALSEIESIYDILKGYGCEDNITIDLSLVQNIGYYTGMVFKCMTSFVGACILSGGRYDGLSANFGKNLQSTGFAMDIKKILIAIEKQGALQRVREADIIALDLCNDKFSFDYIQSLRNSGSIVKKIYNLSEEQFIKENGGAQSKLIVLKQGAVVEVK